MKKQNSQTTKILPRSEVLFSPQNFLKSREFYKQISDAICASLPTGGGNLLIVGLKTYAALPLRSRDEGKVVEAAQRHFGHGIVRQGARYSAGEHE